MTLIINPAPALCRHVWGKNFVLGKQAYHTCRICGLTEKTVP